MIGDYGRGRSADGGAYYDNASVCRNGHMINDAVNERPEKNRNFCNKCGAETLLKCEFCSQPIIGRRFYNRMGTSPSPVPVPSYCADCGKAYPWTRTVLEQANELIDLIDELSEEEKRILKDAFPDLLADTPKTQVAALRTGKLMNKVEGNFKTAFREIFIGVATEGAKAMLKNWGMPF
jgi:hypothetical protein